MRKSHLKNYKSDSGIFKRVKIRYRKLKKDKRDDSESDVLLSADEELLGANENLQQRSPNVTVT